MTKGDDGFRCTGQTGADGLPQQRRRLHFIRLLVLVALLSLTGFFGWELLQLSGVFDAGSLPDWRQPRDVLSWLVTSGGKIRAQLRSGLDSSMPSTYLAMILKVAICVVLGAVFLRMPQRSH
jgi:hypothetical protein